MELLFKQWKTNTSPKQLVNLSHPKKPLLAIIMKNTIKQPFYQFLSEVLPSFMDGVSPARLSQFSSLRFGAIGFWPTVS